MTWVIARTKRKRPTLMHKIDPDNHFSTLCGVSLVGWSRAYSDRPIPQVQCLRCTRLERNQ